MKIVVIAGSGLIGSKLVMKLREQGQEVVAASPATGVNSLTCEGLADALKGAAVAVDVTNSPSWEDAAEGNKVRLPAVLFQPMAADDVASAVSRFAMSAPVNATVETGGPEQFRLDKLVRRDLAARKDPREAISDSQTRFDDWLRQSAEQVPMTTSRRAA